MTRRQRVLIVGHEGRGRMFVGKMGTALRRLLRVIRSRILPLWLIVWSGLLTGCVHYSTSTLSLPSNIRTIAIPLFENMTVEAGIKEPLTDEIIARFVSDNHLKVVDARDADAIITGTIVDVREEALSFEQGRNTKESRVWIFARVRYEDVRRHKVLWEENPMQAWGVFQVVTGTDEDRKPGIAAAIKKMADDILNKTIAGW